jgi:hypothetical protein
MAEQLDERLGMAYNKGVPDGCRHFEGAIV